MASVLRYKLLLIMLVANGNPATGDKRLTAACSEINCQDHRVTRKHWQRRGFLMGNTDQGLCITITLLSLSMWEEIPVMETEGIPDRVTLQYPAPLAALKPSQGYDLQKTILVPPPSQPSSRFLVS
ncbi:hypothetical protein STEG23_026307, partial [Scotinomys teguina]